MFLIKQSVAIIKSLLQGLFPKVGSLKVLRTSCAHHVYAVLIVLDSIYAKLTKVLTE